MNQSLRRRLAVGLLAGGLASWWVLGAWLYWRVSDDIHSLYDRGLADTAHLLEGLVVAEASEYGESPPREFTSFLRRELRLHLSQPLQSSVRAFHLRFGVPPRELRSAGIPAEGLLPNGMAPGFSTRSIDGERWRIFTSTPGGTNMPIAIATGERFDNRTRVIGSLAGGIGAALLGSFALLAWFAWRSIEWSLAPLARIRDELAARSPTHLGAIPLAGVPLEVQPMIENLNVLLARLDTALLLERELTANAAHELRTPIAGIRMQAQVAQRAIDLAGRNAALAQVIAGVDRATRLIEQLLSLARVDPALAAGPRVAVNLQEAVADCYAALHPPPGSRFVNDVPPAIRLLANADALDVLLRNLLDNALKHGGSPPWLRVTAEHTATGEVRVSIEDNGAGISAQRLAEVQRRFVRGTGATAPGSGLGLAIVGRIAALEHAQLTLRNRVEGGRCVELRWPAA